MHAHMRSSIWNTELHAFLSAWSSDVSHHVADQGGCAAQYYVFERETFAEPACYAELFSTLLMFNKCES